MLRNFPPVSCDPLTSLAKSNSDSSDLPQDQRVLIFGSRFWYAATACFKQILWIYVRLLSYKVYRLKFTYLAKCLFHTRQYCLAYIFNDQKLKLAFQSGRWWIWVNDWNLSRYIKLIVSVLFCAFLSSFSFSAISSASVAFSSNVLSFSSIYIPFVIFVMGYGKISSL